MKIPELITEKFTLRPLREADLDELVQICTDPETVRWTTVPLNYTRDDAQTFLTFTQRAAAAGRELTWAIDDSGVLAGAISLRLPEGSANAPGTYADLGFYTAAQMRGRGIMTDAVRTVLGFGFDPLGLGLDTIGWAALVGNAASERVAVKAGFTNITDGTSTSAARPDKYGNRKAVAVRQATMTRTQFAEIWRD
ncbi:N-acetyltransferase [Rothia sp. HSID18069]|jgi:acetyltransferase|uniref:GNAT family N-acetyltransferase n=1 Tax=Rothia TaxID=32207 RepID=UPI000F87A8BE|nr:MULTISPECIES: GNAT family N-acetyltransferase [Rothia]QXW92597.1 GNAT family N-acetyltransferase [Rothia aeria]RUP72051.1 N-acetyltransferase [Rothia sp. HSID18069]